MGAVNLSGTAAWSVDEQIPPGTYLFRPAPGGVETDESSNGNPQVKINWRVAAGEFTGAERLDWLTFTEAAMGRVVQLLEACAIEVPQADFAGYGELRDWVAEQLRKPETQTMGVVRLKESRKDPSKSFPEIVGYKRPSPSDLDNDASGFTSGPKVGAGANGSGGDRDKLPF
jgi:hypothetical protein